MLGIPFSPWRPGDAYSMSSGQLNKKTIAMHLQYANGTHLEKCDIHIDVVALHKLPIPVL